MTGPNTDKYESAVEQAIATCNGDIRGALKALIIANEYLETEMCALLVEVSKNSRPEVRYARAN